MADMSEKFDELEQERAISLAETLRGQGREGAAAVAELDKRLTNTNFLTNGGGAVAMLTFMGSGAAVPLAEVALVLFTFGVVATGIELRALLKYWAELTKDANRRHRGFLDNELTVKECLVPKNIGKAYENINHFAGLASQLLFVAGAVVGGLGFFYCGT